MAKPQPIEKPVENVYSGVRATDEETRQCSTNGSIVKLNKNVIEFSNKLDFLGPRGTLSNEGRILRWCLILNDNSREALLHGPSGWFADLETNTAGHGEKAFFDSDRCARFAARAHKKFANELSLECQQQQSN